MFYRYHILTRQKNQTYNIFIPMNNWIIVHLFIGIIINVNIFI